jgi:hypothetical protein
MADDAFGPSLNHVALFASFSGVTDSALSASLLNTAICEYAKQSGRIWALFGSFHTRTRSCPLELPHRSRAKGRQTAMVTKVDPKTLFQRGIDE